MPGLLFYRLLQNAVVVKKLDYDTIVWSRRGQAGKRRGPQPKPKAKRAAKGRAAAVPQGSQGPVAVERAQLYPQMTMPATPGTRRTTWPDTSAATGGKRPRVGIVVANFNTRRLIAQLVFSLYRLLGRSEFTQLVVVDNASTDGSRELLNALHDARLIHLIRNPSQRRGRSRPEDG